MSIGEQIRNALQQDTGYRLRVAMGLVPGVSTVHVRGRNPGVDTTERVLWAPGAVEYGGFLTAPSAVRVKAGGNANDTAAGTGARRVLVTGLDGNLGVATEELVLAGASASSPSSSTFLRLLEAHVTDCGSYTSPYNAGDVSIETTGGTELIRMLAGRSQSQVGVYTVPAGHTLYVARLSVAIEGNKVATVRLWRRSDANVVTAPCTAKRMLHEWPLLATVADLRGEGWESYPAATDLWFAAYTASGTTAVSAELDGYCVAD